MTKQQEIGRDPMRRMLWFLGIVALIVVGISAVLMALFFACTKLLWEGPH